MFFLFMLNNHLLLFLPHMLKLMKQHTKILFVIAFCLGVLMSADAQKNKTKNTKPSTKEDIPLPPPPMEELKEVRIDTLSIEEKAEADASSSQIPSPQIEF